MGTTTRLGYKVDSGVLTKRKVRMCVRGDQQTEESFNSSDLYSFVLKAPEARLSAAVAAEYGCPLLKTNTRHCGKHFYGEMGDDKYIFDRLTGGQSLYPKVMYSCFSKASMAPSKQPEDGTFIFQDGWSLHGEKRLSSGK